MDAASELVARPERPTAVVAWSDEIAMGVLYAVRSAGLRVPQDVSVIGVDDHDLARLFDLTTVAQPVREQGRVAARLLVEKLLEAGAIEPDVATVTADPTRRPGNDRATSGLTRSSARSSWRVQVARCATHRRQGDVVRRRQRTRSVPRASAGLGCTRPDRRGRSAAVDLVLSGRP
jgi:hypothetical protein